MHVDFLIFFGIEAVFRIFFALVERISDRILQCNDFETTMELLRTELVVSTQADMEAIFESSLKYDFGKSLEQYRVEYKILQEEFAHLSLINSKNYTSQPNINRQSSVDRFLTIELSGSNDSIDSRRKHASEVQDARTEINLELGKLKHDKGQLEQENSALREMLIQLERQVNSLKASNRQFEENNESLVGTIQRLESRVKTLESGSNKVLENIKQFVSHGSKKNSESDDEKCFVYVDAEEFPDPL